MTSPHSEQPQRRPEKNGGNWGQTVIPPESAAAPGTASGSVAGEFQPDATIVIGREPDPAGQSPPLPPTIPVPPASTTGAAVADTPAIPDFDRTLVIPADYVEQPASAAVPAAGQGVASSPAGPVSPEPAQPTAERDDPLAAGTLVLPQSQADSDNGAEPAAQVAAAASGPPPAVAAGPTGTEVLPAAGAARAWGTRTPSRMPHAASLAGVQDPVPLRARRVATAGPAGGDEQADFEIVEKLAEGGMGVVYVARQRSLNRELAIKTLKTGTGQSSATARRDTSGKALTRAEQQRRDMFISEALVTANLVHPNIIPIHELAQTDDGNPYYVMKRVQGVPWNSRITELSLADNLEILHKVCDAVAFAHHHGVINRDLKPENIMLGEFGEVLVLDWGLAVPAPHAVSAGITSPVASYGAGTPAYMAPELWTGPATAIGEWSDIYLLGAILFEIITGKPPHDFAELQAAGTVSDPWQAVDRVLRENHIRDTPHSGELLEIALHAMQTQPAQRFPSVLAFQSAIRDFQRHEESRRLSSRAKELLQPTEQSAPGYDAFQKATALLDESLRLWTDNRPAAADLRTARLSYAQLAAQKGDFDLGLQIAALDHGAEFVALTRRLQTARRLRSGLKWTTVTALLSVILLGAKSLYDNGIITDLNAQIALRRAEADAAIGARNKAMASAEAANSEATEALAAARSARQQAIDAAVAAEAANQRVAQAAQQLALAESSERDARQRQTAAETAARIAQVEIQTQSIRGLTLNENYSDALRELERLLQGDLLPQLPEQVRQQRTVELQAQRAQLLKRVRQSEAPVQTQAISPDGRLLALGDSRGLITIFSNPAGTDAADLELEWPAQPLHSQLLGSGISFLQFVDGGLLAVSGQDLVIWSFSDSLPPQRLSGHAAPIRGCAVQQQTAVTGDADGLILVWDLSSRQPRARMQANTQLCDLVLLPDAATLIFAGSRGGQSADILAYRLPDPGVVDGRLERLEQMRMPRSQTTPPLRLSVAPDGSLLAISSSVDGQLLLLPAITDAETAERPSTAARFPFAHPADLAAAGRSDWLLQPHRRPINQIAWSQDSQRMLTASDDRSIGIWQRTTQASATATPPLQLEQQLRGHGARVHQAIFLNAAATRLVSCSADHCGRLWDLQTIDQDRRAVRQAFDLARISEDAGTIPDPVLLLPAPRRATPLVSISRPHPLRQLQQRSTYLLTASGLTDPSDYTVLNEHTRLHRGSVRALRFAPDGQQLVSGASDGSIVLWDAVRLQPITQTALDTQSVPRSLFQEGHEFNVSAMQILKPSGNILATAGFDGSLRLWNMDLPSGRAGIQQQALSGLGLVNTFAASEDGRYLVTSSLMDDTAAATGSCSLWELHDVMSRTAPTPLGVMSGLHTSEVTSIAVAHNGKWAATGARDGMLGIWSLPDCRLLASGRAHRRNTIISGLHWLDDGTLLSAGLDGQLLRWTCTVAAAAADRDIQLRDAANAGPEDTPPDHSGAQPPASQAQLQLQQVLARTGPPIESIAVAPDHSRLVALSVETQRRTLTVRCRLQLWELASAAPPRGVPVKLARVAGKAAAIITAAHWSGDGRRLLVCADGLIQVLETDTWTIRRVVAADQSGAADAQFADELSAETGRDLITTFDGNTAQLWDLSTGERLADFRGPGPISSLAIHSSAEQSLLLSGSAALRLFDGNTASAAFGQPLFRSTQAHTGRIVSLDICPTDRHLFVSAGSDGTALLWRWQADQQQAVALRRLWQHDGPLVSARWDRPGRAILLTGRDGSIQLYSPDGSLLARGSADPTENFELLCGEFSADGRFLVIAGRRVTTGESIGRVLQRPTTSQLATDSARLPADSAAPAEVERLTSVCQFSGHSAGGITAVAFLPDSPWLVSGGTDGALILWNWQQPLPGDEPAAYEALRLMADEQLTAHRAAVTAVSAADDGRIASAGDDGRIIIWLPPLQQADSSSLQSAKH